MSASQPVQSQNLRLIDSLKRVLPGLGAARQFEVLNEIGFEYRYSFPDSTILYCNRAYVLGQSIELKKVLSRPLSFIGLAKANQGDYKAALDYHNRSIHVAIEQQDTLQLAHGYNNIGRIFFDEGDLARAYKNFMEAKELFESIQDKSGLAYVHRSLASLFKSKNDFIKALQNSEKALALRKELGDPRAIASAYMELGLVYEDMDTTSLALRQFVLADSIATAVNDQITKAELSVGIAEILFTEHRMREAEEMAKSVLSIVSQNSNQKIYLRARLILAKCMMERKDDIHSLEVLFKIYESSAGSGNLVFQRDAAGLISRLLDRQKNFTRAREYSNIYQLLNEKIQNTDLNKEIERLQFQLQIEKTEKENESLKAKQVRDESVIAWQGYQNKLLILVAGFIGILAIFTWRVSRKRKIINQKLEDQNLHILRQREEISRHNEVLSGSNRELDELNHEKDTLMNIVAHDLKSPLNRISGLIRILENESDLNTGQREYIRLMKESTRGGLDLITDLLDVHAWKELRENPKSVPISFDAFFREKIQNHVVLAEAKQISVVMGNSLTTKIISEPNYLARILDNLLSNAIKFSPRGSQVIVSATHKNGYLRISIKDSGPGFVSEDLPLLYQKFKKLSARPTAGESSNGLGLAIVKILIDRLQGTIELVNGRKGSEFIVQIPAPVFQEVHA